MVNKAVKKSSKYKDFRIGFCRQWGEKSQLVLSQAKEYPYLNRQLFTLQDIVISILQRDDLPLCYFGFTIYVSLKIVSKAKTRLEIVNI